MVKYKHNLHNNHMFDLFDIQKYLLYYLFLLYFDNVYNWFIILIFDIIHTDIKSFEITQ